MAFEQKTWYNDGVLPDDAPEGTVAPCLDADNLNRIESGIAENENLLENAMEELKKIQRREQSLLWENASPTSSFAGQNLALDLNECKSVAIETRLSTSMSYANIFFVGVGSGAAISCRWASMVYERTATATATGVAFGSAAKGASNSASMTGTDNTCVVPLRIWGIK